MNMFEVDNVHDVGDVRDVLQTVLQTKRFGGLSGKNCTYFSKWVRGCYGNAQGV